LNIKDKIESLVSSKEEFEAIYESDYIYIVKGNFPDDNDIIKINVASVWDWKSKLRGPYEGPAKLANNKNNHDWSHGYIWGVSEKNKIEFERSVILPVLKTGYRFEKISVTQEREEEKQVMFGNLFSEC